MRKKRADARINGSRRSYSRPEIEHLNGKSKSRRRPGRMLIQVPGFGEIDGRTREAWYYRQLVEDVVSDLGGIDNVSRAEIELTRRAAGLGVLASQFEARIIDGRPRDGDIDYLTKVASAQVNVFNKLGLRRRARDVNPSPTLRDIIDGHAEVAE